MIDNEIRKKYRQRMISEAIPTEQKKCAYEPEKICITKCKYYRTCVGNPNKI